MNNYNTLRELYLNSVEQYGDRPWASLYGSESESMTYSEFAEKVEGVVEMLHDAGLKEGDKVALLSRNLPNWSVCFFAVVSSGMVIVPILPGFSPDELAKILEHSESKALMVSDRLFRDVPEEALEKLNVVIRTVSLTPIAQNVEGVAKPKFYEPKPEDLAAIIYTSGTTSAPKGVMLSHQNWVSQAKMAYDLYPVETEDIFLSLLPLPHTYECSIGMLYPFSRGSSIVYLDRLPSVSTLMPALADVRPHVVLSVPLIMEKIYRDAVLRPFTSSKFKKVLYSWGFTRRIIHRLAGRQIKKAFGGRLHFFGVGGAKLEPETERFLSEAKFPYAIGYGLTETAPLIAGAIPGKVAHQSTGPVLSQIDVRLEGAEENGGEGEIVINSPSTMMGYYKDPEQTKKVFTEDGWFRTNDLGRLDENGNLFVLGRLDNMIVGANGENIYPEEIESVINSHRFVSDSLVKEEHGSLVALVHFDMQEIEKKYQDFKYEFNKQMAEIKKELLAYVNSKVSRSSRVSSVEQQEEQFEKTPTLKIKRFKYVNRKRQPTTGS